MTVSVGIALAFVAMLSWGLGDFWMQKAIRRLGNLQALFFIAGFGAIVLLPFVYQKLPALFSASSSSIWILATLCVVLFFAAILDFEALRVGKLSVVETVWSFEVPVSALLALFVFGERPTITQMSLIAGLLIGLSMISVSERINIKKFILEKGFFIALMGAIMMGGANFMMGWSSRVTDPVMANFVADTFISFVVGAILIWRGDFAESFGKAMKNARVVLETSIADKVAWLAFSYAMVLSPIAIAVALSESYIIIAVVLGIVVNRDKLVISQRIGLALALISATILAFVTA